MIKLPPKRVSLRSTVPAVFGLALCLMLAGCNSNKPDPSIFNQPSNDAYALSGGKITHYTSTPFLPADPAAKGMLLACRQLPIKSHTARSAFLVITAGQFGKCPLHALVIGKQVLMLPGDLATMGIEFSGDKSSFVLYPRSSASITLKFGSRTALVGSKKVPLEDMVVATDSQDLVMNWADMLTLLKERDRQRHQPPFIRDINIIYDIQDYHR